MSRRILVTGAAGFIGSRLIARLLDEPGVDHVLGVDAFIDYYPREMKEANLAPLRAHPKFKFVEANLAHADILLFVADRQEVYHQAAQAGVRASWGANFALYTECNILATQRLLEACKLEGRRRGDAGPRVVYASSSSIYGETTMLPMHEDHLPRPVSPYGVSKLAAEHLCRLYTKNFNVPTVSLRYFTVYGPGQRPDMAFTKFLRATLAGQAIDVYGDGHQTRDFTFIDDAVSANIQAMARGTPGAVYNIGGGSRVSLEHVFEVMGRVLGTPLQLNRQNRVEGDVTHTYADTTAARRDIGFSPLVSLEEGLKRQAAWVKQAYGL